MQARIYLTTVKARWHKGLKLTMRNVVMPVINDSLPKVVSMTIGQVPHANGAN